jgi:TetR/AcrR family transcriptional repressor of nem operon
MPRPSVREQIVVAALETLHQRGFNATSVQDITDAAKVPKGSFYNHFDSKESLAVEALDRYWQMVLRNLDSLGDETKPPLERLKTYFRRIGQVARDANFGPGCMVGNMSAEMPGQSRPVRDRLSIILAAWSRSIESCVRDAQADGSIRSDLDPRTIAAFLLNSWEGAVMRSKVDRDATAFEAFEQIVFTSLGR